MINRLIIIGNGFDLAHGLKTRYSDFLEDYYSSKANDNPWSDKFLKPDVEKHYFHSQKLKGPSLKLERNSQKFYVNGEFYGTIINDFFFDISLLNNSLDWVDIENAYFRTLLEILNLSSSPFEEIRKLNREVDEVFEAFEKYLSNQVVPFIGERRLNNISQLFEPRTITNKEDYENFLREYSIKASEGIRLNYSQRDAIEGRVHDYKSLTILNFNYTNTAEDLYASVAKDPEFINIHGTLHDKSNPINFGFGDEMNKKYGEIEDMNENEYLRLMKSFAYSNNDNYRKLFRFIDNEEFQVHIMGHSCGISDRTLLNSIFEHHNCKSIKVFYHVQDTVSGLDNYSEIIRNISRHFNQKSMMRSKIVNKSMCRPLPQSSL